MMTKQLMVIGTRLGVNASAASVTRARVGERG
jgi:hypothetical protein